VAFDQGVNIMQFHLCKSGLTQGGLSSGWPRTGSFSDATSSAVYKNEL